MPEQPVWACVHADALNLHGRTPTNARRPVPNDRRLAERNVAGSILHERTLVHRH